MVGVTVRHLSIIAIEFSLSTLFSLSLFPHTRLLHVNFSCHMRPPRQPHLWPHHRRRLQLQRCGALLLQQRLHPGRTLYSAVPGQPPVESAATNMPRSGPATELPQNGYMIGSRADLKYRKDADVSRQLN